jgi:hypothetical protein
MLTKLMYFGVRLLVVQLVYQLIRFVLLVLTFNHLLQSVTLVFG